MLTISLWINILVLIPVTVALWRDAAWTGQAYGPATPGRGILLAIYLAILVLSALILLAGLDRHAPAMLALQVIYKLLTAPLVGLRNPVVLSNLAIAAFHGATLATLWQSGAL